MKMRIPPGMVPPGLRPVQGPPHPVSLVPGPRPPGSPPAGAPPVLPGMPAPPYSPPVPEFQVHADPPVLGMAEAYEAQTLQGSFTTGNVEQLIYTTKNRWRACDVYFAAPGGISGGTAGLIVTFMIFGVTQSGSRSLIATGRVGNNSDTGQASAVPTVTEPTWVASARGISERFQVTLIYHSTTAQAPTPTITGNYNVTIIATDEAINTPEWVGRTPVADSPGTPIDLTPNVLTGTPPRIEVVGVQAVNKSAAARYLQLFDTASGALAGGATPNFVWPLGAAAGNGISDMTFRYRLRRGLYMRAVDTAGAAQTDVQIQALIR